MNFITHNSDGTDSESDMRCDSFMAQLVNVAGIAIAALLFAACIALPLYFGNFQP